MTLALAIVPSLERSSKELLWAKVEAPRVICAASVGVAKAGASLGRFQVEAPRASCTDGVATAGTSCFTGVAPPELFEGPDGTVDTDPDWVDTFPVDSTSSFLARFLTNVPQEKQLTKNDLMHMTAGLRATIVLGRVGLNGEVNIVAAVQTQPSHHEGHLGLRELEVVEQVFTESRQNLLSSGRMVE